MITAGKEQWRCSVCSETDPFVVLLLLFSACVLLLVSRRMLKRRPSKRFVLAETGEESSWDTTMDNDATGKIPVITTPPPTPPVINLETAVPSGSTSTSSSVSEDGPVVSANSVGTAPVRTFAELKVPALNNVKLTESGRLKYVEMRRISTLYT